MKALYDLKLVLALIGALTIPLASWLAGGAAGEQMPYGDSVDEHFHAKGKPPSDHTLAVIEAARESMPFEDTRDHQPDPQRVPRSEVS